MSKKSENDNNSFPGAQSKSLLLIRHAKSSWNDFSQKDFERPLNNRGQKDAPEMAKYLKKTTQVEIDLIVSSPAKRALATAFYFAKEFDIKKKHIIQIPTLYEPSVEAFYNAIINFDDTCKSVALFSHNPGVTAFANQLTNVHIDDMPTCGVFALRILTNQWQNFNIAEKEFWFFNYPKNITQV